MQWPYLCPPSLALKKRENQVITDAPTLQMVGVKLSPLNGGENRGNFISDEFNPEDDSAVISSDNFFQCHAEFRYAQLFNLW